MPRKTGIKLTVATIVVIIITVAGVVYAYGRQSEQLDELHEHVKTMEPEVKANTEGRIEVQGDIKWIKGAVERIEKKL